MAASGREWVTVAEAAQEVGVSVTTIRDWYRAGSVETVQHPSGRVVRLEQVRERAMGLAIRLQRSDVQHRIDARRSTAEHGSTVEAELLGSVRELQEIARQRLEV